MYLTSASLIEQHVSVRDKAAAKMFNYVHEASRSLKHMLGADKYQELLNAAADDEDKIAAARAESYLCAYNALPFLNLRVTDLGGFSKVIGYGDREEQLMGEREMMRYQRLIYARVALLVEGIVNNAENEDLFQGNGFGFMAVNADD